MASKVLGALACVTAVAVKLPPAGWHPVTVGLCLGATWVLTLQALLLRRLLALTDGSAPPSYAYTASSALAAPHRALPDDEGAAHDAQREACGDDFRGWLWIAAASQASLKPKLPEAQGTAKRFGALRGSRLLLTLDAAPGGEPPVEVDLRGCEVYAAPDPVGGGPLRRWWRRLPLIIVHRGRPVLFNERALCLFAATSFEKEAWHTALSRACASPGGSSPAGDAALSSSYSAFLRAAEAAMRAAGGEGLTAALAAEASPASLACLNLFSARYFFDLQRNARVEAGLAERLQQQLLRADIPPWMTRLRVVRVALPAGGAPPRAQRLALAAPGAHPALADVAAHRGPIPAYEMDISYLGGIIVEVETTIDATALAAQHGWRLPPSGAGPASGEEAADSDVAAADADAAAPTPSVPSPGRRPLGQALQERLLATPAGAALQDAAARLGQRLSSTPIRLSLEVLELSGTLRLWLAPPPGDRLWLAFTAPPTLRMRAAPALGARAIAHAAVAARVSDFISGRMRAELAMAAVLPNTADVLLAGLIHAQVAEMDVAAARRLEPEHGGEVPPPPPPRASEATSPAPHADAGIAHAAADAPPPPQPPAAARALWSGGSSEDGDGEEPRSTGAAASIEGEGPADRGGSGAGGIAALIGLGGGSSSGDDEDGALNAEGMLQLLRTTPPADDAPPVVASAATSRPVAAPPRPPRPSSTTGDLDLDGPPRPSSLPGRTSSAGAATLRRRSSTDGGTRPVAVPPAPPPAPAPAPAPVPAPAVSTLVPTPRSSGAEPAAAEAAASALQSPPSSPPQAQQGAGPAWVEKLRAEAARRIAVEGPKLQHAFQTNHDKLKAGILAIRAEQAKKLAQTAANLAAATAAAAAQQQLPAAGQPPRAPSPAPAAQEEAPALLQASAFPDASALPSPPSVDDAAPSPPPLPPRPAGKED